MYEVKFMDGLHKSPWPYIRFAHANRELLRPPNATFGVLGKIIGNAWRSLSIEEKARYDTVVQDPMIEEAKRRVLTDFKYTVDRLKHDPTPNNVSFVGEEYRAAQRRWNEQNNSNTLDDL